MLSLRFSHTTSRRAVVRSAALAAFGAALPLASRAAKDRYVPYRGQTVAFSVPHHAHHPHFDAMRKLLPQFTCDTGIKVEVTRESILRMKPPADGRADTGTKQPGHGELRGDLEE